MSCVGTLPKAAARKINWVTGGYLLVVAVACAATVIGIARGGSESFAALYLLGATLPLCIPVSFVAPTGWGIVSLVVTGVVQAALLRWMLRWLAEVPDPGQPRASERIS